MKNLKSLDIIRLINVSNIKNANKLSKNSKDIAILLKENQNISIKIQEDNIKLEEAYKNTQEEINKLIIEQINNNQGLTQKVALATLMCEISIEDILNNQYDNHYGYIEICNSYITSSNRNNILKIKLNNNYQKSKLIHWSYILKNKNYIKSHNFSFKTININNFKYCKSVNIKNDFYNLPFINKIADNIKIKFDIAHIFWLNAKEMNNILLLFKTLKEDFTISYDNLASPIVFKSKSVEYIHSNRIITEVEYDFKKEKSS